MSRPSFAQGIYIAVLLSGGGALAHLALRGTALPGGLRLVLLAVALGYILWLLTHSSHRSGRVSLLAGWLLVSLILCLLAPSVLVVALVQSGFICLTRALCLHRSSAAVLADAAITSFALLAALWALAQTGGVLAPLWVFLLLQSLCVALPPRLLASTTAAGEIGNNRFETSYRAADSAVRRLARRV